MKKHITIYTSIIAGIISILFLTGCINQFSPSSVSQETGEQGTVTIQIGNNEVFRTLFPQAPWYFSFYKLEFTPESGQAAKTPEWVYYSNATSIALPIGTWTITAIAYINDDVQYEAARGSKTEYISSGYNNNVVINIYGIMEGGTGVFEYDLAYPNDVSAAVLQVLSLSGELMEEVNLVDYGASGSFPIEAGFYLLRVELERDGGKIVKAEVVHIAKNLTTMAQGMEYNFTNNDFLYTIDSDVTVVPGTMTVYYTNDIFFNMAAVPGRVTFPTGEYDNESAAVVYPYQIGETAVTWELWNTVRTWAIANGYNISEGQKGSDGNGSEQQPVTMINWYDAVVWCNALTEYWNEKTGAALATVYNGDGSPIRDTDAWWLFDDLTPSVTARGFRLPLSNEWELAARWRDNDTNTVSGYSNPWFTKGDSASGAAADVYNWTATGNAAVYNGGTTSAVKSKLPNTLGLYDMSGNVWEWCSGRITRGGAYTDTSSFMRIGYVHLSSSGDRQYNNHGFRLARTGYKASEVDPTISFTNVTADGSATTTTTSKLTLIFGQDINDLTVTDISLTSGSTGITKESLNKTGIGVYELTVSGIRESGSVGVTVAHQTGYNVNPATRNVYVFYVEQVSFESLSADGSETVTTTALTLTFSNDIAGLTAADITLTPGDTGITKGALNRIETGIYELTVSGIIEIGSVGVTVAEKAGYNISPAAMSTSVHYFPVPVTFVSLTANGGNFVTTTMLTLTFSQDIPGLSLADITFHGSYSYAQKGFGLYARGDGVYDMEIMGISNGVPGDKLYVTVNKSGYNIDSASQNVSYYYAKQIDFNSITANGSPTQTTTMLTLMFHNQPNFSDVQNLNMTHITLSGTTGAIRGALIHAGGTNVGMNHFATYNLYVSGVNQTGSLGVTVANISVYDTVGFVITNGTKNTQVYYYPEPVNFTSISADGSATSTTTKLTFNFNRDVTDLNANDITLDTGDTGAVKGELIRTGTGVYELDLDDVSANGQIGVVLSKYGFAFNPASRNINVHYAEPVEFIGVTPNDGGDFETTTMLTLTFDEDIDGLVAADITLTPNDTGVTRGELTRTGTGVYELAIGSVSQSGSIGVTADKAGYSITPKTHSVTVYYAEPAVFASLVADGSIAATTTKLTLGFDKDIIGLSITDITLESGGTGIIRESLDEKGDGVYELAVSGIAESGIVGISVSKTGYAISGTHNVNVYAATHGTVDIAISLWVNEDDGQILASENNITISKSGSDRSFTAMVNSGYTNIQWTMLGYPVKTNANGSVTINASDYNIGTYRLNVTVYKNTVPYSTEIRFTVTN
ncbi:MAG: formylglycine-generating enzyme family protein [Treponema sp.]|nr:formylglycine-generating enzyme family protein [Treponema sp.]